MTWHFAIVRIAVCYTYDMAFSYIDQHKLPCVMVGALCLRRRQAPLSNLHTDLRHTKCCPVDHMGVRTRNLALSLASARAPSLPLSDTHYHQGATSTGPPFRAASSSAAATRSETMLLLEAEREGGIGRKSGGREGERGREGGRVQTRERKKHFSVCEPGYN